MEMIQEYLPLLTSSIPPALLNPLITVLSTLFGVVKFLQTHLTPLIQDAVAKPDLTSILVLVAILFVSFKILGMAYRAVMFWVTLALRLAVWGVVGLVGFWIYTRGLDGFTEDVQDWAQYWSGEYDRYSSEVKRFQKQQEGKIRSKTG
ncbi:hypothetical protein K504DRAFT_459258 [Pleomassaria siparia CBS 279.74]|uniref:Nuclear pore assembly and biogenesis-domain-containing protein n=1 Tax=Pleomassaria siparia CBS 279.74 TaxID=1314801 RepID=A0A6G1K381_9PLEO|nr:hypothetical protein K504DRAFT_459258 [Pleomassaria siparia CBS 279.74]